jgi:hypothetical protein
VIFTPTWFDHKRAIGFTSDAVGVTILADPSFPEPARGRTGHHWPRVQVEQGTIAYQFRNFSLLDRLMPSHVPFGEVRLNPSIPWEVEFHGGISKLNADLRGLDLQSIDLLGGASQIRLLLSRPAKTTFIYITGGVRNGTLRVPSGVGIRVQVSGGASNLAFDHQNFAAIGGDINLENADFRGAASRCEICISGGASNLMIENKII